MDTIVYISIDNAVLEHNKVLEVSGGTQGILNENLLRSSVEFIQNDTYYPSFIDKLTHLMYSVIMNHCFIDGNKRSAISISALFLSLNGYGGLTDDFIVEMENIVVCVARGVVTKTQLSDILDVFLKTGEVDEATKVMIISGMGRLDP